MRCCHGVPHSEEGDASKLLRLPETECKVRGRFTTFKTTWKLHRTDAGDSEIIFGGYRPELLASDIVWADVAIQSYWQVAVDDITFDTSNTALFEHKGCQAAEMSNKLVRERRLIQFSRGPQAGWGSKSGSKVLNLSPQDHMDEGAQCSFLHHGPRHASSVAPAVHFRRRPSSGASSPSTTVLDPRWASPWPGHDGSKVANPADIISDVAFVRRTSSSFTHP